MTQLLLLGPVDLRSADGHEVRSITAQPKRLALLAVLAVAGPGVFVRRDRLLALFWPESDDERARGSLRQAVRFLRRSLGETAIVGRGDEELGIAPGALRCDVAEFEAALDRNDPAAALARYRGDLLESLHVADAPGFEAWLSGERQRLRQLALGAAVALATVAEQAGDAAAAVAWARRAAALGPEDETVAGQLMRLLDATGDRGGALAAYGVLAAHLEREYQLEPSPETRRIAEAIRAREYGPDPTPQPVPPPATAGSARAAGAPPLPPRGAEPRPPARRSRGRRRFAVLLAGGVLLAAGAALWLRTDEPSPPVRVVVPPLENRTGEAGLDALGSMAADWIVQGLATSDMAEVVPLTTALAARRFLGSLADARDSAERTRVLARETGASLVVNGSYYRDGDSLHFQLRVDDVAAGRVRAALPPLAVPRDSVVAAVSALRAGVLAALAAVTDTVGHARAAATPPSYEAYREYVLGVEAFVARDLEASLAHYARAAEADTAYALPRLGSAITLTNMGRPAAADSAARAAARMRAQLGPFERHVLDLVQAWLSGDERAAFAAAAGTARLAPGSLGHYQYAEQARRLNRPRLALRILAELDPERGELRGWFPYWREVTLARHMLGQHRRELRAARRGKELYPGNPSLLAYEARALAALGETDQLELVIQERLASPGPPAAAAGLMLMAAAELRAHGHDAAAQRLYERTVRALDAGGAGANPAQLRLLAAAEAGAGRLEQAERVLRSPLLAAQDLDALGARGVVAARRGDRAEAARVDALLAARREPYELGEPSYWRACIAAQLGEPERAVALLRAALAEGLQHGTRMHADPDLAPLRAHREFRRLLEPRD